MDRDFIFLADVKTITRINQLNGEYSLRNWLIGSKSYLFIEPEGQYRVHYSPSLDCTNKQNDNLNSA
jgi:hypothetical protein